MVNPTSIDTPSHVTPKQFVDFDMYDPCKGGTDLYTGWQTLQKESIPDIVWTPKNGGHWIPTKSDIISEVMRDYERFSSRTIIIPKSNGADHNLIPTTLDPPEHRPFRMLLNNNLAWPRIQHIEPAIRSTAIELIENVRKKGRCNFTNEYAEHFPLRIFISLMGLPLEEAPRAKVLVDKMMRPDGTISFAAAMQQLFDYLEPFVDDRRGGDGGDVISHLVNGEVGDRIISKQEAMKLTVQLLIAGLDTVVNFLGFVMLHLATNKQHQSQLRNDPGLIPEAVEELLRRFPIVTVAREVVADMEFHGASLKAGDMIATPTPLWGWEENKITCPMDVDFKRKNKKHLSFGTGHHFCPGRDLARAEIRVTLEEWMKRIPEFSLAKDEGISYGSGIVAVVDKLQLNWNVDN